MIPTPHTLQIRRRTVTGKDSRGNDIIEYGAPEDWPVHGVAPGAHDEPSQPARDLSMIEWTVTAPVGPLVPSEHDLVIIGSDEYRVDGRPRDWSMGPWDFADAGVEVLLARAEG